MRLRWLYGASVCGLILMGSACLDTASLDNDNSSSEGGAGTDGQDSGGTEATGGTDATGGAEATGGDDSSTGGEIASYDPSLVAGTVGEGDDRCASYSTHSDEQCGSYYCNVDLDTLTSAMDPAGECSSDAAFVCDAILVETVAGCTRDSIVQVGAHASLRTEESEANLRAAVQECVDEELGALPETCLTCFIDAAVCTVEQCLQYCATEDNPECDRCRQGLPQEGEEDPGDLRACDIEVFDCAGLPSPF